MANEYKLSVIADNFHFLEAPRWREGRVWVADVFQCVIYSVGLDGSRHVVAEGLPEHTRSFNFLPDGTPVITASQARKLVKLVDGKLVEHADLSKFAKADLNDFAVDRDGRIYAGNLGYNNLAGEEVSKADIHIVEPDGSVRIGATGVEFANGAVIINDGRTYVVGETWAGTLLAYDRDPATGNLSNRRYYATLPGREPDGICADADGAIWVPSFGSGEVLRVLDGGEITDRIQVDGRAVACTLGGADGKTLFCCCYGGSLDDLVAGKWLGSVQAVTVDVPGPGYPR